LLKTPSAPLVSVVVSLQVVFHPWSVHDEVAASCWLTPGTPYG
jgi:hypothetical protein